jgi:DedD protein
VERKTKQRILGLVVVLGLGIILYPLFQSEKQPTQTAEIKPPPFPDQPVQIAANDEGNVKPESDVSPIPINMPQAQDAINQQPDDTINPAKHAVLDPNADTTVETNPEQKQNSSQPAKPSDNTQAQAVSPEKTNVDADDADDEEEDSIQTAADNTTAPKQTSDNAAQVKTAISKSVAAEPVKQVKKVISHTASVKKIAMKSHPYMPAPLDNNGLAKLKNAAWVIQMGSFKKKENALRLVNSLRARGYRAFIQQVNTNYGDGTRVFVGPEGHEPAARALASRLENDIRIRGVVISYKPLAL